MAKLYEVETTLDWVNLNTLVETTLSGNYELFNAGVSFDKNVLYTESVSEPTSESYYKVLNRQDRVLLNIGDQPVWVRSEVSPAKLIISDVAYEVGVDLSAADITEQATAIADAILNYTGVVLDRDLSTTADTIYTQIRISDTITYIEKMDTVNGTLTYSPNNTAWADRVTASYTTRAV